MAGETSRTKREPSLGPQTKRGTGPGDAFGTPLYAFTTLLQRIHKSSLSSLKCRQHRGHFARAAPRTQTRMYSPDPGSQADVNRAPVPLDTAHTWHFYQSVIHPSPVIDLVLLFDQYNIRNNE